MSWIGGHCKIRHPEQGDVPHDRPGGDGPKESLEAKAFAVQVKEGARSFLSQGRRSACEKGVAWRFEAENLRS